MDNRHNKDYKTRNKPAFCCLVITDRCMLKCKMCHKWKEGELYLDSSKPNLENWKRFMVSLRKFVEGELCINFSGGEPLMDNRTLELIKFASNLGFDTLLTTNGYLIDEETAKKIINSGLKHIFISLDSLNEDTHDFLRGVNGAYKRVMNAIEYLNRDRQDLRIKISTIILENNLDSLVDLANWVIHDERISSINFQAVTQPFNTSIDDKWYEKSEYNFLWPKNSNKVNYILDELIKLKMEKSDKIDNPVSQFKIYKSYFDGPQEFAKKFGHCIGKQAINITASGQIHIYFDMEPIGNINIKEEDFDIERLWYSSQADLIRNGIKNRKKDSQTIINCNYDEKEICIN